MARFFLPVGVITLVTERWTQSEASERLEWTVCIPHDKNPQIERKGAASVKQLLSLKTQALY